LIYTITYDEDHRAIFIGGSRGCCQFQDYIGSFPGIIDDVKISSTVISEADTAQTFSDEAN
jgi:hypothetical protein